MKELLFVILLISPGWVMGQEKIKGLGEFKINESDTIVVYQYAQKANKIIGVLCNMIDESRKNSEFVYKLQKDEGPHTLNPIYYSLCPEVVVFSIPTYKVAGIEITNMHLYFYQNKLVRISSDGSYSLMNALETKYGAPQFYTHEGTTEVTLKATKSKIDMPEKTYFNTWNNEGISATCTLTDSFDEDGVKELSSFFWIEDTSAYQIAKGCDQEARKILKEKEKEENKRKLLEL